MLSEAIGIGNKAIGIQAMKKLRIIFCAILFLTGMSIALYPYISNRINEKHASSAITSYDSEVKQLDEEKVDALKEAATKYNDQLSTVVSAESTESESSAVSYADLVDVEVTWIYHYSKD